NARVEIDAAFRAAIEHPDRDRQQIPASRAAKHFVRRHQVRRLRPAFVLQHAPWRALLRRRLRLVAFRSALARLVLIAALTVFPVAHVILGRPEGLRYCDSVGVSEPRNSFRYEPHTAGREWVP